jgi:hypothetical protein
MASMEDFEDGWVQRGVEVARRHEQQKKEGR